MKLFLVISLLSIFCHAESQQVIRARQVIDSLQSELKAEIALSEAEWQQTKLEYQEYYLSDIKPLLNNISEHILPSAMHWIDFDGNGSKELLFWTEGLAPTSWGAKECLFIVSVKKNQVIKIIHTQLLKGVSRSKNSYKHVRFWLQPNKNRGYNDHLKAVLSYADYGVSGTTYHNYQIGWNRYGDKTYVDKFMTSFPIDIKPPKS